MVLTRIEGLVNATFAAALIFGIWALSVSVEALCVAVGRLMAFNCAVRRHNSSG